MYPILNGTKRYGWRLQKPLPVKSQDASHRVMVAAMAMNNLAAVTFAMYAFNVCRCVRKGSVCYQWKEPREDW